MLGFYNTNYRKKSCFKSSWLLAMSRRQDARDEYLGRQVILGLVGLNKCCLHLSVPNLLPLLEKMVKVGGGRPWV